VDRAVRSRFYSPPRGAARSVSFSFMNNPQIVDSTALTSHSPRTRNKFVRRARVRNAADRLAMQTRKHRGYPRDGLEPPNGPSKLYTLNPDASPSELLHPEEHMTGQTNVGCPRARERVCITPQGPVTVAEINSRL
jgi:hypothetical protein